MTVLVNFSLFNLTQLNASSDFSRPLGQWELIGVAVGDVTGGAVSLFHTFNKRYIYSLESWNATKTLGGLLTNFSVSWNPNSIFGVAWHQMSDALDDAIVRGSVVRDSLMRLPLSNAFLSQGFPELTISAQINVNAEIYRGNAWGYYWDKRAILAPQGLFRP